MGAVVHQAYIQVGISGAVVDQALMQVAECRKADRKLREQCQHSNIMVSHRVLMNRMSG